ncbi:MAG: hypothetical protein ACE37K_03720 [Planctomycetota bacterium]
MKALSILGALAFLAFVLSLSWATLLDDKRPFVSPQQSRSLRRLPTAIECRVYGTVLTPILMTKLRRLPQPAGILLSVAEQGLAKALNRRYGQNLSAVAWLANLGEQVESAARWNTALVQGEANRLVGALDGGEWTKAEREQLIDLVMSPDTDYFVFLALESIVYPRGDISPATLTDELLKWRSADVGALAVRLGSDSLRPSDLMQIILALQEPSVREQLYVIA